MDPYVGRILEFRLEADGRHSARIACPKKAVPRPGQYLLADHPKDDGSLLSTILFPQRILEDGFLATPAEGPNAFWTLGASLNLRGPLGKGFQLPGEVRNLALADLAGSPAHLLPLLPFGQNIAMFSDSLLPDLPLDIEIQPLSALPEAGNWADFTAVSLQPADLSGTDPGLHLRQAFGLPAFGPLLIPGQVLVIGPMPCGGLADCGVCALRAGKGYKLACKDGPVFQLSDIHSH